MKRIRYQPKRVDLMFLLGVVLALGEFLRWHGPPNQALLILAAGLMGLPIIVRNDKNGGKNGETNGETK